MNQRDKQVESLVKTIDQLCDDDLLDNREALETVWAAAVKLDNEQLAALGARLEALEEQTLAEGRIH